MPRKPRLDIPGALHHIMIRGNNKIDIFKDDQDRIQFLERLKKNIFESKASIYAWVLMSNHVHLLLKSGEKSISTVMRKVLTGYAINFNKKYNRSGHLFENRYKSILCDEEKYLMTLIKYIHRNPIRAGVIKSIKELDEYKWSGHRAIIGKIKYDWMDIENILGIFGKNKSSAVRLYREYIQEGKDDEDLEGGGLIKTYGGWSAILSMRKSGIKYESDDRILGESSFVEKVMNEREEQIKFQKKNREKKTSQIIIKEECRKKEITIEELKSISRRRKVSETRKEIIIRIKKELGKTNAEIARELGVNTSSVTRVLLKT